MFHGVLALGVLALSVRTLQASGACTSPAFNSRFIINTASACFDVYRDPRFLGSSFYTVLTSISGCYERGCGRGCGKSNFPDFGFIVSALRTLTQSPKPL